MIMPDPNSSQDQDSDVLERILRRVPELAGVLDSGQSGVQTEIVIDQLLIRGFGLFDPVEREVLILSYGLSDGQFRGDEEVAKEMGLPVKTVTQLLSSAYERVDQVVAA
ncbi:MAG: hypothetical protein WD187_04620 [Candidatus Woykebacteria bacterium]